MLLFVLLLTFVFCVELLLTEPEALRPAVPEPLADAPYVEFVVLLGVVAEDVELLYVLFVLLFTFVLLACDDVSVEVELEPTTIGAVDEVVDAVVP